MKNDKVGRFFGTQCITATITTTIARRQIQAELDQ